MEKTARFLELVRHAVAERTLVKLTLGKYRGGDETVRNVFVRVVTLKTGPHLSFLWRHATRDVTKNLPPNAGLAEIERLLGSEFLDAHLFTATQQAQLEMQSDGSARLHVKHVAVAARPADVAGHDATKKYPVAADAPWLRALGVTNDRGQPREGMSDKFRQIQKFAELLGHLVDEAFPDLPSRAASAPLEIADMGSGKGYLTFAIADLLGGKANVRGIETRPALVDLCNKVAAEQGFAPRLTFSAGTIASASIDKLDVLIALHACDTATDDALARGIRAGARLLVVAPCCQKEVRRQLVAPPVLGEALRHGIFQERHAEFATDALRAHLLEYAGYRTKVFEFISTEHTAKNVMIAGVKAGPHPMDPEQVLAQIRSFAGFYGIRSQALARRLGVELAHALDPVPPTHAAP